ncbi:hypothetical protein JCM11251_001286 [Rhodosporidiobolus azoricus]
MSAPLQLLLLRNPRTLVLASQEWALLFRSPPEQQQPASSTANDAVSIVVELLPRSEVDLDNGVVLNGRVSGCLGVLSVGNETFLAVITHSTAVGAGLSRSSSFTGLGCEPIFQVRAVDFFCLSSPAFDYLHAPVSSLPLEQSDYVDDPASTGYLSSSSSSFSPSYNSPSPTSYTNGGVSTSTLRGQDPTPVEHPCQGLRKILSNSSFYYSSGPDAFDLSTRLQARVEKAARKKEEGKCGGGGVGGGKDAGPGEKDDDEIKSDQDGYQQAALDHDARFLWNTYLVAPLLSFRSTLSAEMIEVFDREGFMVLAIQGFVGRMEVNLGGQPAVLSLISRLSWKRSGTRFNVRGVADDGSVANFVETETVLRTASDLVFSFVQTRGSVPLFWEEGGAQPFNPKITITRPVEASLPAFLRHFEDMLEHYDKVHIINLLGTKEGEAALTTAYSHHLQLASQSDENIRLSVRLTEFDFHARSKVGGIESVKYQLQREIGEVEEGFGACVVGLHQGGEAGEEEKNGIVGVKEPVPIMQQTGVFRTNCKDVSCLDRTNAVSDSLSSFALRHFLQNTQPTYAGSDTALWASHRVLWADNGDALSKIYVGTGAINTSFTRTGKKSLAGMLSDATKSVSRVYQQQFVDNGKQKAIDALLGNLTTSRKVRVYNPIHDALRAQLRARAEEFTTYESTTIWVGTYNLNGKPPGSESLLPWLFPVEGPDPAFLVIAFQEIVPLSPGQIMATDPEKKRRWEQHILDTVSSRPKKKEDYILLRSGQLVGTALIVLCRKDIAGDVQNIEAATKKTGLKGMAGNKGAVAIRLDYKDTSFCFPTAHLAAGHSNVEERNQDYFTIANGLHFSRGRGIAEHDNIVWAADTNYRISLPNEEVRGLAEADAYDELYEADQLNLARRTRGVFSGYEEAAILFRPTYKYDNGTDIYDSSEKNRIPAYTDRILYKGVDLDASRYQRAELMSSDHRPVYALFRSRIRSIDHSKRTTLRKKLLQEIMANQPQDKLDDKVSQLANRLKDLDLPPPSDDLQAWWNEPDGSFKPPPLPPRSHPSSVSNPFDSPSTDFITTSPPSQRRAPPAVPPKKTVPAPSPSVIEGDLLNLSDDLPLLTSTSPSPLPSDPPPTAFQAVRRKPPPPLKPVNSFSSQRSNSPVSIRSVDSGSSGKAPPPIPRRPGQADRQSAGEGGGGSLPHPLAASSTDELGSQVTGDSWTVVDR